MMGPPALLIFDCKYASWLDCPLCISVCVFVGLRLCRTECDECWMDGRKYFVLILFFVFFLHSDLFSYTELVAVLNKDVSNSHVLMRCVPVLHVVRFLWFKASKWKKMWEGRETCCSPTVIHPLEDLNGPTGRKLTEGRLLSTCIVLKWSFWAQRGTNRATPTETHRNRKEDMSRLVQRPHFCPLLDLWWSDVQSWHPAGRALSSAPQVTAPILLHCQKQIYRCYNPGRHVAYGSWRRSARTCVDHSWKSGGFEDLTGTFHMPGSF